MGTWTDFEKVTEQALGVALEDVLGAAAAGVGVLDRRRLALAFEALPAADGAREALVSLRAAGIVTGVLSNGSAAQLRRIVDRQGLADVLDHVLSVDAVRVYKPDRASMRSPCPRRRCPSSGSASSPAMAGMPPAPARSASGSRGCVPRARRRCRPSARRARSRRPGRASRSSSWAADPPPRPGADRPFATIRAMSRLVVVP